MHIDGDDLVDAVILSEVLADDPPPRPAETPVILTPTQPLPPPMPGVTAPPEFPASPGSRTSSSLRASRWPWVG